MLPILIVDGVLLLIIVISCIIGVKRGFVKMLMDFAGIIIAIAVACIFTAPFSSFLNEKFVDSGISSFVEENIISKLESGGESNVLSYIEKYMSEKTANEIKEYYEGITGESGQLSQLTDEISNRISVPVSSAMAFLILFVVTLIAVKLLTLLLDLIFKLPGLKQANKILGFLIGAICGIALVMVISRIFVCVLPLVSELTNGFFTEDLVEKTYILNFFNSTNIFKTIIGDVSRYIG